MRCIVRIHHNSYTDINVNIDSDSNSDAISAGRDYYDNLPQSEHSRAFIETREDTGAEVVMPGPTMSSHYIASGWYPTPPNPEGVETDDEEDYEENQ